ncbi:MAG: UDP-N-acetylmuramate dehydrogenase [Lactobacillus sp.]|nr:UDP-N-acetylmuramate dehydrogenase [Lactobacillus sp.]
MNLSELKNQGYEIYEKMPLSEVTFTKTGGPADFVAFPKNRQQVEELVDLVKAQNIPLTVIGNASNLIIKDGGIRGLVMILTRLVDITVDEKAQTVTADAGAAIIDTAFTAAHHSLSGLEFAAGIPGSVGGGVYMNAGAYDGEVKDCLKSATVITRDGEIKTYDNQTMNFSYRHSYVQDTGDIVLSATFQLKEANKAEILAKMEDLNERRRNKQPLEYPSCGSVFKRPVGHFVGPMIIKAGLQGTMIGGAQNSTKHAGFIVNKGGATATDYLNLIHLIQRVIKDKYDIDLETEVRIIGEEPKD